jgi:Tol biopolymer transport system component
VVARRVTAPFWAGDDADRHGQIYVIDADGSNLQQLTHGGDNRWPIWSPDGTRIAFVRNGTLFTMVSDGTDLRRFRGVEPEGTIAWNPVTSDG